MAVKMNDSYEIFRAVWVRQSGIPVFGKGAIASLEKKIEVCGNKSDFAFGRSAQIQHDPVSGKIRARTWFEGSSNFGFDITSEEFSFQKSKYPISRNKTRNASFSFQNL